MIVVDHKKRVCVLLIEDSANLRKEFRKLLEKNHAVVHEAKNHAEATEVLKEHWPVLDLILLDACVEPPGLEFDAHRFLHIVRPLPRGDVPPVRILGFSSIADHLVRMKVQGCTHVCRKFVELDRVVPDLMSTIIEEELSGEFEIPTALKSR